MRLLGRYFERDVEWALDRKSYVGSKSKLSLGGGGKFPRGPRMKQIFVTSFNQFKKALTNDAICAKVWPHREHILVVADEAASSAACPPPVGRVSSPPSP